MKTSIEDISRSMQGMSTSELLEIWRSNDRAKWSPDAFEAIRRLLTERGVVLPAQSVATNPTKTAPDQRPSLEKVVSRLEGWLGLLPGLIIGPLALALIPLGPSGPDVPIRGVAPEPRTVRQSIILTACPGGRADFRIVGSSLNGRWASDGGLTADLDLGGHRKAWLVVPPRERTWRDVLTRSYFDVDIQGTLPVPDSGVAPPFTATGTLRGSLLLPFEEVVTVDAPIELRVVTCEELQRERSARRWPFVELLLADLVMWVTVLVGRPALKQRLARVVVWWIRTVVSLAAVVWFWHTCLVAYTAWRAMS